MIFIGIGKNYVSSEEEKPTEAVIPTIFTKPENSALLNNATLRLPAISEKVEYELELAYRIGTIATNVSEASAWNYIDAVTIAIDFTAKDVLAESREKTGPWALAKGFDGATPISAFQPIADYADPSHLNFSLDLNEERVQTGDSRLMVTSVPEMIAYVTQFITLKPGDVLLTGTPAHGKGFVKSGDRLEGTLEGKQLMDFVIE